MRLHHLEMTAFGPFADTVAVDFDELASSGLFLLTGATGAGKSSVLDGVCFALYGDVPGDRATAKRLRSDQAPPERCPRVSLEVTLAGRRFRLHRSPAWQRPKKRGTGLTPQQATVAVSELVDGEWVTLSTRLDETGHLVTSLVGMTLAQFCQVAMLPQGRFQAFLRARSEERHALLARVFQTGRFEEVERWLRERRTTTRRAAEAQGATVTDLLSRVSETAGEPLPGDWPAMRADLPDEDAHGVTAWSAARAAAAAAGVRAAAEDLARARTTETSARARHAEGAALAENQRRHAGALAELDRLDELAPAHAQRVARLAAAHRAAPVTPLLRLAADAGRAADRALGSALAAMASAGVDPLLDDPAGDLATRVTGLADRAAAVRATLPRETHLAELERTHRTAAAGVQRAEAELDELTSRRTALPALLEDARASLADSAAARSSLAAASDDLARVDDRLAACRLLGDLEPVLATARAASVEARSALTDVRERWLAVREARLEGMAAELASRLAVGGCCPVCGSAEHPQPAAAASGAPDAAAEKAARRLVDDAEAALHLCEEEQRAVETEAALARQRAGDDPALSVVEGERATATKRLADLERRAQAHDGLVAAVHGHQQQLAAVETAVAEAEQRRTAHAVRRDEAGRAITLVRDELAAVLADSGHESLRTLLTALEHDCASVTAALDALATHDRASREHRRAAAAAHDAARQAGFVSTAQAAAAVLAPDVLAVLDRQVREHEEARTRAAQLRDDPDLVRAAAAAPPDLATLDAALATAEEGLMRADRGHAVAARRHDRVAELHRELLDALRTWAPLRAEHRLAADVAAMVDGSSPDNRLQMRLSAYVLAHRLSQVVDAANERLGSMSDQRYSLEHTGRRGAGETRGGLSLLVRDDWSGESRDPATLSGGETFVVSLALALGLADVIAHEAGGAELDTLFVDEGFGSLDADTLDHVMDTLDALRDGGRVVGVVSHVSEMRDRIPAQLEVATGRAGSSLALRAG